MTRWTNSSRLRFAIVGIGFGSLLAATSGCPAHLCPNCKIKAAVFEVEAPDDTEVVSVTVSANGEFTGHCPGTKSKEDCNLTGTFESDAQEGKHQVTLEGWSFDQDDGVSGTATVTLRSPSGGPPPPSISIPLPEGAFEDVKTGKP